MTRQQKIAIMKKRRKQCRLITTVFVILTVIVITLLITSFINRDSSAENVNDEYIEYTVKSGDTLWDIAQLHSGNNVDVRTVIYDIEETNQIKSAMIYCGDILLIPAKYCGD